MTVEYVDRMLTNSADPAVESRLPFLKWAGGKRWFVNRYLDTVPVQFDRYIEPFLGSGALFFALKPRRAILSDVNAELIATFGAIRANWKGVVALLREYQGLHSNKFYYRARSSQPKSAHARAAKFIYLNRTCWNGLYRVNKRGQFNVPIGTRQNVVLSTDDFCEVSTALKRASLVTSDFEPIIRQARRGDLIFADPPYVTAHSQNGFLKYNEKLFCWNDQVRLRDSLREARERGVQVLATNADCPLIRGLYEGDFTTRVVTRSSAIASSATRRGVRAELVITSW
jgi:DNA adenine methylase